MDVLTVRVWGCLVRKKGLETEVQVQVSFSEPLPSRFQYIYIYIYLFVNMSLLPRGASTSRL